MKKSLLIYLCLLLSIQVYGQCISNVTISQSAQSICSGYSVTLTATPSGGAAPFTYIWSTGETTQSISVDKAGTYSVIVSDKTTGCQPVTSSTNITVTTTPGPPTAAGTIVCPNTSATLTATAPGGTYQWYDAAIGGNFLATGATYTTPPITALTTFYVETTINGCTGPRTAVNVNITHAPGYTGETSICSGNAATLTATGGSNYSWSSAPTGGTVLATGDTFTTPVLTTSTNYYLSYTANGCTSPVTTVTVHVNPTIAPPVSPNVSICSGSSANLVATGSSGIFNWYNVASGGEPLISSPDYTTPPLTATTVYYVAISANGCESARTAVTVTVTPQPAAPATQTVTTCYQSSVTLNAGANLQGTVQWYDAASNLLATGPTYTTPVLTSSTTYYVQVNNGGCASTLTPITVAVNPQLPPPSATGSIICPGSSATLTATSSGGGTYQWYSAATGGTLLATGSSYTTPQLTANTTYYVQNTIAGCISPLAAVTVTVTASVPPPAASNISICSGNTATLTATGAAGGSYAWYNSSSGGTLLSSTQVFVSPVLTATTTYYVDITVNGCTSALTPVTVTVTPSPSVPVANPATVCPGTSATLTATAATGTIKWYNAASGGTLLATGTTYTTPALTQTTTYYVESVSGQCTSTRTAVTVTIYPQYNPQFQYPAGTFCTSGFNPTPAINNPNGGTFSATPAGLVFVSTQTGEINAGASTPGKYVVSFTAGGPCPGTSTADISIVLSAQTTFSYGGPYCQDGANPAPIFPTGSSAGTFSSSPAGLVFVNTSTGEINLSASSAGTYTITNTFNASGACSAINSTSTVTVEQAVTVSAGPAQTVPAGTPVQLAGSISGGATTGTWTGGTGTFSNASLTNAIYTPGPGETSATLTLTSSAPTAPCGPKSASVTITFNSTPAAPTAQSVTDCSGSSVTLSATAPGGTYQWYDAATGGNLLATGPNFTTPALTANNTYYVQTTIAGITSSRTTVNVTVNTVPAAPVVQNAQVCTGNATTLTASGSTGTYEWYDAATGGNLVSTNSTYTTPVLTANVSYYVQAALNGCTSTRTMVSVTVTPVPNVTSASTSTICSGLPLNYTMTANMAAATFSWSRAPVAGISNPAVTNQTSSTITETLLNTSAAAVNVTYVITAIANGCSGPAFNFVVTVNPTPVVISPASDTICSMSPVNYTPVFNTPVNLTWSRPAVAGISNLAVSGQTAGTIKEVLFDTTNYPVVVTYNYNYLTSTCNGTPFSLTVTVNPLASITSLSAAIACSGVPQDYVITSNIPTATFIWSRDTVPNISNPAVTNQTSSTITETLINTGTVTEVVTYTITPISNGCPGTRLSYRVTVNPQLTAPVASSNSPICVGSEIHLSTPPIPGAAYLWTGPNGFTSTEQNPNITNVTTSNTGNYTLVLTIKDCQSPPATVPVNVDEPPVANAGPNQMVCFTDPAVSLAGTISGGTTTGIWSGGSGTFLPSSNTLNAQYIPSPADTLAGSVVLTLTSTSKDNCNVASSTMTITFGLLPAVNAGPNQTVCSQATGVTLAGAISIPGGGKWSTSGSGNFNPSATQLDASYAPSAADTKNGSVILTLTANDPGGCYIPSDSTKITFDPPPKVYAGGTRFVLKGNTITLYPTVNQKDVHYLWSPDIDINNDTLKNPVVTGDIDRVYTLTVTDSLGCIGQDTVFIKVGPKIIVYNTFTPNGDGVNDYWNITGLIAYQDATVDIFDRYGQQVFHSLGYPKPWDGTYNGRQVPVGVYYYIINTHYNGQVLSGYVTVIR